MSMELAREYVRNGKKLLECEGISLLKLDPQSLDIVDTRKCVLGQLYGDYYDGMRSLGLWDNESMGNGYGYGFYPEDDVSYDELNVAWRELIEEVEAQKLKTLQKVTQDA